MALRVWTIPVFAAALYGQQITPAVPPPAPPPAKPAPAVAETADNDEVIRAGVEVVNVLATVRGKRDAIVSDLTQADFKIFEDDKEQTIKDFARDTSVPLSIALMIDASMSMDAYFKDEQVAGTAFFRRMLRPNDKALVAAFRTETELLADFTNNIGVLEAGLMKLDPKMKVAIGTVLYDSIKLVAEKRMAPEKGRKVMVVITDGADYNSRNIIQAVITAVQKAETVVYIISYPLALSAGGSTANMGNQTLSQQVTMGLDNLVRETGGKWFKIAKGADLNKIFEQIETEMRSQYSLSYSPTNTKRDGKFRKIEIKMSKREYTVSTRLGYFAPKE